MQGFWLILTAGAARASNASIFGALAGSLIEKINTFQPLYIGTSVSLLGPKILNVQFVYSSPLPPVLQPVGYVKLQVSIPYVYFWRMTV